MADTKDFGRLFFHVINIQREGVPFLHRAFSQEIEAPFREARPWVLKFWPGKGLVFGLWHRTEKTEEQALYDALEGWGLDLYGEDLDDPDVRQTVRENVARNTESLDEEWQILSALGVSE
jgi:hypothetical protein